MTWMVGDRQPIAATVTDTRFVRNGERSMLLASTPHWDTVKFVFADMTTLPWIQPGQAISEGVSCIAEDLGVSPRTAEPFLATAGRRFDEHESGTLKKLRGIRKSTGFCRRRPESIRQTPWDVRQTSWFGGRLFALVGSQASLRRNRSPARRASTAARASHPADTAIPQRAAQAPCQTRLPGKTMTAASRGTVS